MDLDSFFEKIISPKTQCAYCSANNFDYVGHTKRSCPKLAALKPCHICGASGFDNHTASQRRKVLKRLLLFDVNSEELRRALDNDLNIWPAMVNPLLELEIRES